MHVMVNMTRLPQTQKFITSRALTNITLPLSVARQLSQPMNVDGHVSQGGTICVFSVISEGCMAIACTNHGILYITGKLIFLTINLCCQMWSILQNKYVSQLELLKNRWFLHVPCYVRVKKIIINVTLLGNGRRYFDQVFFGGMPRLYWM